MDMDLSGPSPADQFLASIGQGDLSSSQAGDVASIGLPADQQSQSAPPGLESTVAAVSDPPAIASVSPSIWQTIKSDAAGAMTSVEKGVGNAWQGTKNTFSTVGSDLASIPGKVTSKVTSGLSSVYMYLLLAVVVIAGALYFIGKGGLIGQAKPGVAIS